jgi:hypothetical protein
LARAYGVDRGQQVNRRGCLLNVTIGAQTERLSYDIRRGLLAHEEKSCVGDEPADLFSDLESMHLWQVDIEQNQIRLQLFGLLNGLQPIRCLDGVEIRPSSKRRTNEMAERRMVLDDENPQQRHLEQYPLPCEIDDYAKHSRKPESRLLLASGAPVDVRRSRLVWHLRTGTRRHDSMPEPL